MLTHIHLLVFWAVLHVWWYSFWYSNNSALSLLTMFSSPDETGGVPKEWKMNVYDRGEAMGNYRLLTIPIFSIICSFCTLHTWTGYWQIQCTRKNICNLKDVSFGQCDQHNNMSMHLSHYCKLKPTSRYLLSSFNCNTSWGQDRSCLSMTIDEATPKNVFLTNQSCLIIGVKKATTKDFF